MSESFLTAKIGSAAGNGIHIERSSQQKQEQTTAISSNNNYGGYDVGDEFVSSFNRTDSIEQYTALQNAINENEYNKLTSSTASKLYEKVSSSITSLFSGNKSTKINQTANEDFAYFSSSGDDDSEYADLKYFANAMGNSHITSTIKEYESMKQLLGVTGEEVFENC